MNLHNNNELFNSLIKATSDYYGIDISLIEKDYYVTMVLMKLNDKIPGLMFKGGTCLSKCFKVIDRFSEDIDLTLDNEHFSQSQKRHANKLIIEVSDETGLELKNRERVESHSHSSYNAYFIDYPKLFPSNSIKTEIKVEMVFIQKAYPYMYKKANSYIGEYLEEIERNDLLDEYGLKSFLIKVQTLERTFVDKVFAICDYYLRKDALKNSRHLYDIYKIIPNIELDKELGELIKSVREDRKKVKRCVSSLDGIQIPKLLDEIIETEFYKDDYMINTKVLLIKKVDYEEVIKTLKTIISSKLFN